LSTRLYSSQWGAYASSTRSLAPDAFQDTLKRILLGSETRRRSTQIENFIDSHRGILNKSSLVTILHQTGRHQVILSKKSVLILADEFNINNESFTARCVGNALNGMQDMSSNSLEVQKLLVALTKKVESCTELLGQQAVVKAVLGLQGMRSNSGEVRKLLAALTKKIEPFCNQELGYTLYGLQQLSSDSLEGRNFLAALTVNFQSCKDMFDAQAVGNALYGLQKFNEYSLASIVPALLERAECILTLGGARSLSAQQSLLHGFVALMLNEHIADTHIWKHSARALLHRVTPILEKHNGHGEVSEVEDEYAKLASRIANRLKATQKEVVVDVLRGQWLHGFMSDILIHLKIKRNGDDLLLKLNVEIDGPSHRRASCKNFASIRDKFLHEHCGIIVYRIDVMTCECVKKKTTMINAINKAGIELLGVGTVAANHFTRCLRRIRIEDTKNDVHDDDDDDDDDDATDGVVRP
jgi:very-short-patch-repair endonuclease